MTDLPKEVAALRKAVNDLANRCGVEPAYRPADRIWRGGGQPEALAEWDVQYQEGGRGVRQLAVRAGWPDGIPGVFLVDYIGDMHALSVADTHRLIEALSAAVLHVNDEVTARRARKYSATP